MVPSPNHRPTKVEESLERFELIFGIIALAAHTLLLSWLLNELFQRLRYFDSWVGANGQERALFLVLMNMIFTAQATFFTLLLGFAPVRRSLISLPIVLSLPKPPDAEGLWLTILGTVCASPYSVCFLKGPFFLDFIGLSADVSYFFSMLAGSDVFLVYFSIFRLSLFDTFRDEALLIRSGSHIKGQLAFSVYVLFMHGCAVCKLLCFPLRLEGHVQAVMGRAARVEPKFLQWCVYRYTQTFCKVSPGCRFSRQ